MPKRTDRGRNGPPDRVLLERLLLRAPILAIVGTRPEAIKQAPVVHALARRGLAPTVVFTGQHPMLDPVDFGLSDYPVLRLGLQSGDDPLAYSEQVAAALTPAATATDLILVQGDTSSALGGALAGFRTEVPVGHVEAGLRSFDLAMPWPEEGNRIAIDRGAALLFAPTADSAANLRAEGVAGEVHVTGNTAIDALADVAPLPPPVLQAPPVTPRVLVTCHRRENWGAAFGTISAALLELARHSGIRIEVLLHPNPHVATIMRRSLDGVAGIHLQPPLDHRGMVQAMRKATVILSDSGGVQEEAPALGIPLLVLRDKTERPEALATGNMILVGTDTDRIVREVLQLVQDPLAHARMAVPALPYGDGQAGERIAVIVEDWLAARGKIESRLTA